MAIRFVMITTPKINILPRIRTFFMLSKKRIACVKKLNKTTASHVLESHFAERLKDFIPILAQMLTRIHPVTSQDSENVDKVSTSRLCR